jgi:hypothetical protein
VPTRRELTATGQPARHDTEEHEVQTETQPSIYARYARAFTIFAEYDPDNDGSVAVEHDQMWAGPDPASLTAEHIAELEQLGWHADAENETWQRWV